jgi:hypothetical protein
MPNVYSIVEQFETLCIAASNAIKSQQKYKLSYVLAQLGLAPSTYRDRLKEPRLWSTAQLKRLSELLPEEVKAAVRVLMEGAGNSIKANSLS